MNFFMDENFPKSAHSILTQQRHSCFDARDHLPQGAEDTAVFQLAQKFHAVFLTTDKDFYHTVPFLHPSHHGVVVVSLLQPNRRSLIQHLECFLNHAPSRMDNTVYLLRDRTFYVKKTPPHDESP